MNANSRLKHRLKALILFFIMTYSSVSILQNNLISNDHKLPLAISNVPSASAAPVVTGVFPLNGTTAGGTFVIIDGNNFNDSINLAVDIDGFPCSIINYTNTQINVTTPVGGGTNKQFRVHHNGGSHFSTFYFSYNPPEILSLETNHGPTTGGTILIIFGNNFGENGYPSVTIGGITATVLISDQTSITISTPEGIDIAELRVTLAGQFDNTTFQYDAPTIDVFSPNNGPTSGGTSLDIMGSNFGAGTPGLTFDGVSVTVDINDHSTISCTTPAGVGSAEVNVTVGTQSVVSYFTYNAPSITSVTPDHGSTTGGSGLIIEGINFGPNESATVKFDGIPAPVQTHNHTHILLNKPEGTGSVVINVTVDGQSDTTTFDYDAPSITDITPNNGPTSGGTPLVIVGNNFGPNNSATVTFDGVPATVLDHNHTHISLISPVGTGAATVQVNVDGQSDTATFNYDTPTIDSITPNHGPTTGGTAIVIVGNNFGTNQSVSVTFDGVPVTVLDNNHTHISLITPVGTGSAIIQLTVDGKINSTTFSYDSPSITTITPNSGPTTGGTSLIIVGEHFGPNGSATVTFDGVAATILTHNHTHILLETPHGTGSAVVQVTVDGVSDTDVFNYDAPSITTLTPDHGPTSGGMFMTIVGQNFGINGSVSVKFDGIAATIISNNHTHILLTTPEGTEIALISINVNGQIVSKNFTYDEPSITDGSPNHGPTSGGNQIVITGLNFGNSGFPTVKFDGVLVSVQNNNHTHIFITIPEGTGSVIIQIFVGIYNVSTTYSYDSPSVTSISPNHGPTSGNTAITIIGTNFGLNGSVIVTFNDIPATIIYNTHSIISILSPEGTGSVVVKILVDWKNIATIFNYDAPTIKTIAPNHGPQSGGTNIVIVGTNFGVNGSVIVKINNVTCKILSNNHTSIKFIAPKGIGTGLVQVIVDGQSVNTTFTYNEIEITTPLIEQSWFWGTIGLSGAALFGAIYAALKNKGKNP
jgi:IPT/TIG domain-containing protein